MSIHITAESLSQAWRGSLEATNDARGGTATHLMTVVSQPADFDDDSVTRVVDESLRHAGKHEVRTVANTIFPAAMYRDPGYAWSPLLDAAHSQRLDDAAEGLYTNYLDSLPTLRRVRANQDGTYFSRIISWPGKQAGGVNQLNRRIQALRAEQRLNRLTSNASDISLEETDGAGEHQSSGGALREYAVTDTRTIGFPCLVHLDISVRANRLALLAIYRHWHLISRGYGNLLGLARLQQFLAQQTGYEVGELAVIAGHANAEHSNYGGRAGVRRILGRATGLEALSVAGSHPAAQEA